MRTRKLVRHSLLRDVFGCLCYGLWLDLGAGLFEIALCFTRFAGKEEFEIRSAVYSF